MGKWVCPRPGVTGRGSGTAMRTGSCAPADRLCYYALVCGDYIKGASRALRPLEWGSRGARMGA